MPDVRLAGLLSLSLVVFACRAQAQSPLPDSKLTPGAVNPDVTQQTIETTICVHGWTRVVRPPENYTEPLKREQIAEYGYSDRRLRDYEEDHLIPLDLGGAPTDPHNLWPEPHDAPGDWGSYAKDRLESRLNDLVCSGALLLDTARAAIASNWIDAYRRYIGPVPDNRPLQYERYGKQRY